MAEITLHSGSFKDRDENDIKVTFYKRLRLYASPESKSVGAAASTFNLSVWSYDGDAVLHDSPASWITWESLGSEKLPNSDYYKYFYKVTVSQNTAIIPRRAYLAVGIEGYSASAVSVKVYISQAEGRPVPGPGLADGSDLAGTGGDVNVKEPGDIDDIPWEDEIILNPTPFEPSVNEE